MMRQILVTDRISIGPEIRCRSDGEEAIEPVYPYAGTNRIRFKGFPWRVSGRSGHPSDMVEYSAFLIRFTPRATNKNDESQQDFA